MIIHPANVVMTAHVAHWVDDEPVRMTWLVDCLSRHDTGDWGDLDPDDKSANNHALRHHEGRVLSRYLVPEQHADEALDDDAIWIITDDLDDPDTSTTILWPSDY